jgi:hypothetical protein
MSTDRDVTGIVRSWLEDGATSLPERVLDDVLAQVPTIPQRRPWWPAWRFLSMSSPFKIALVAAAIGALALVSLDVLPRSPDTSPAMAPSSSPSPSPAPLRDGPLPAGTYVTMPFVQPGSDACFTPPQASCIDPTDDDAIQVTFTVPEGWEGSSPDGVGLSSDTERAALILVRGASLAADPCDNDGTGDIPVGPSVESFVSALEEHPLLSVTDAVETTVDGHPGVYLELEVPDDPTIQGSSQPGNLEGCPVYRPWEPWYLAQGPGELWRLWIVDVDGVRVVVQAIEDASTSAEAKAELQAIVDSVKIDRPAVPPASPSPVALTWSAASLEQDWPAPVRAEPGGPPTIVPDDGGSAPDAADYESPAYHDPVGDVGSSAPSWVDIGTVTMGSSTIIFVDLAQTIPSPVPEPADAWIAYGLVLDSDGDGVADVRLGIDNLPADGGHRAWRTDLHTGRTESAVGAPYGYVGDLYFDTFYPGESGPAMRFSGGGARAGYYVWASVIEDGRIVATDYAPDAGWLE